MTASQVIVVAIPVFLLMMLAELLIARKRGQRVYRFSDAINSLRLGGYYLAQIPIVLHVPGRTFTAPPAGVDRSAATPDTGLHRRA